MQEIVHVWYAFDNVYIQLHYLRPSYIKIYIIYYRSINSWWSRIYRKIQKNDKRTLDQKLIKGNMIRIATKYVYAFLINICWQAWVSFALVIIHVLHNWLCVLTSDLYMCFHTVTTYRLMRWSVRCSCNVNVCVTLYLCTRHRYKRPTDLVTYSQNLLYFRVFFCTELHIL